MNPNPTPKTRFLESADNVSKHKKLVDSRELDRAMDTSMLQLAREMAEKAPTDIGTAASYWMRIQGAHDFVVILKGLAETPQPPPRVVTPNLNHSV